MRGSNDMKEFLILVVGLFLGGSFMTLMMCCLQIDRINKYEQQLRDKNNN